MSRTSSGIAIAVCVFILIVVIVIAICLSPIDYYNYGFLRRRSSGAIHTDNVYHSGLYFVGPDFDFKTYPSTAHSTLLDRTSCTTKDTLEVTLTISIEYFLRPEQLAQLHRNYQLSYEAVIRSAAMEVTKTTAVEYTTEEFIKERSKVEAAMQKAIRRRLGGNCCDVDCSVFPCEPDCVPVYNCTDVGLMVDARYINFISIDIPYKVYNRYLRALLLTEEALTEEYKLQRAVVEKNIESETQDIYNLAREVLHNATAFATYVVRAAEAESLKILGSARGEGLKNLTKQTGLTSAEYKVSADYIGTLATSSNMFLAVDFNNYVIGTGEKTDYKPSWHP